MFLVIFEKIPVIAMINLYAALRTIVDNNYAKIKKYILKKKVFWFKITCLRLNMERKSIMLFGFL